MTERYERLLTYELDCGSSPSLNCEVWLLEAVVRAHAAMPPAGTDYDIVGSALFRHPGIHHMFRM